MRLLGYEPPQFERFKGKAGSELHIQQLPGGKSRIIVRSNPTKYELYHELKHWADYNRLGPDEFKALRERGQEESVYQYMEKQKWLNEDEAAHAKDFIEDVRRRNPDQ